MQEEAQDKLHCTTTDALDGRYADGSVANDTDAFLTKVTQDCKN